MVKCIMSLGLSFGARLHKRRTWDFEMGEDVSCVYFEVVGRHGPMTHGAWHCMEVVWAQNRLAQYYGKW